MLILRSPKYNGPLEYLTMWLCLFLSSQACELLQKLEKTVVMSMLQSTRFSMYKDQPIAPLPLELLQHILMAQSS